MKIRKILSYLLLMSLFGCCTLSYSIPNQVEIQNERIIVENTLPTQLLVNLYIDPAFNDFERSQIVAAMNEWYIQAYPVIKYKIVDLNNIGPNDIINTLLIIKIYSNEPVAIKMEVTDLLGFYSSSFEIPLIGLLVDNIDKTYEPNMFYETILHEMGHAWGLDHLEQDYNSLMYPYAHVHLHKLILKAGSTHITSTDMAYFCSLYQCL